MKRIGSFPVECPHCGKAVVWNLWGHIRACAQKKQRQLDSDRAQKRDRNKE